MKKHILAAAVAAAVAVPAMAQNVSIYGALDGSIQSIKNVGAYTAATSTAGTSTNITGYADSAIVSSILGFRGSEDLGGGLKAVFDLQGGMQTNNGGVNQGGIFNRAANVGLAGGFGEVRFGLAINPLIAANGALMPVSGNSVSTLTATAMGYADFFTKNAVTYTSPNMNGLVVTGQYGFDNNAVDNTDAGSMMAASVSYEMGPVTLRAATQDRKRSVAATAAAANSSPNTANNAFGTVPTLNGDKSASIIGASYKVNSDLTLAAAYLQSEVAQSGTDANLIKRTGTQVGVGYQYSPTILLGASRTASEGSSLTNLQARYSLSKRTTGYLQYGRADNNAGASTTTGAITGTLFSPVATNTGNNPATNFNDVSAVPGRVQSALGAGLIHTF